LWSVKETSSLWVPARIAPVFTFTGCSRSDKMTDSLPPRATHQAKSAAAQT